MCVSFYDACELTRYSRESQMNFMTNSLPHTWICKMKRCKVAALSEQSMAGQPGKVLVVQTLVSWLLIAGEMFWGTPELRGARPWFDWLVFVPWEGATHLWRHAPPLQQASSAVSRVWSQRATAREILLILFNFHWPSRKIIRPVATHNSQRWWRHAEPPRSQPPPLPLLLPVRDRTASCVSNYILTMSFCPRFKSVSLNWNFN